MNVLVCGGAGYIGSNMTATLLENGHKPIVYDNFSCGHQSAVADAEVVNGNLGDFDLLTQTLNDYSIEAVMHFAAFIEVGESVREPLKYYDNNFCRTHTLLCAMKAVGVEKFVFSSTAAVYGIPKRVPICEEDEKSPINPYGDSKWSVEKMCRSLSETGALRYSALRYFNACGAGPDGTLGEDHRPETHLIPLVIYAAMGKRPDIKIFGTDYDTPDGTCIRDYIHIRDLCRAHLLALDKLDSHSQLVFNLGNGKGYSVREVIDTVKEVTGKDFTVVETNRRPGDPPVLTADASKAKHMLGWKPEFTQLHDIVESAWQWHKKHPDGYAD